MKIDFATIIKNLKGEAVLENGAPMTLETVATNALLAMLPDDRGLNAEEKIRRYRLAVKISAGGVIELKTEEIADLKKLIAKVYPPLVVGRCEDVFDPV